MYACNYRCTKPYIIDGNMCKKCLDAIRDRTYEVLCYIPKECKTYELCLAAVTKNGNAFVYVPEEHKTHEMCMSAVKNTGEMIRRIPFKIMTYEICVAAVRNDKKVLYYIPEEYKTYELCMVAITGDPYSVFHIPLDFKTHKFFLDAVTINGHVLSVYPYMPKKCLSRETCLAAVTNNVRRHIPDHFKHVIKEYDFSLFLLGTHERAGGISPVSMLCDDILWTIYSFFIIKFTDVE